MAETSSRSSGMTRNQKKAETRAAILAAAIAAFTEGSAVTTPVEAVARAAGVSKATLFFHFGSRLELLEAVAEEIYRFGVDTIWRPPGPGLAPFLRDYLGAQRTPTTRLLWEIGDVLAMNQRPGPDVAYGDLIDEIAGRLDEEGIDVAMRPALAQVVASATLFVARRMVFNQADDDEIQRFQATVESIIAPWRTRSS